MKLRRPLRHACVAAALTAACTLAAAQKQEHVVKAPHYGDTLFHFFQDRWFDAITGHLVSQHFNRNQPHDDEAEVLKGGMLLSYGMHREAGEVFARLIERNARPAVRDRAWYFLAKIRYQRGLVPEAREALDKVEGKLPPELEDERVLLAAQIRMAGDDYAGAAELLKAVKPGPTSASQYARFNLGVALVRLGDAVQGNALLDELGKAPVQGEEMKTLRDRANVALGFAALAEGRPADARAALQRVRLVGPQSNKALLGFGWAAAEQKDPKTALVPWLELADRDTGDAAVLESKIAVPFAYAELGALNRAMEGYVGAIDLFEAEQKRLDESIAAIRSGALVGALLERNPGAEMGAFGSIADVPAMPHASHFTQILAGHEFQESFKNLRDLQFLVRNLNGWLDKLGTFDDMLANRRQAFAERLPKIRSQASDVQLPAMAKQRDALAAELQQAEQAGDGRAFPDERQRALMERLAGVKAVIAANPDPEVAERVRRIEGALTWELAREYPARLWTAQKALKDAEDGLLAARQHEAALARAQAEEPKRFEAFAQRIAELRARLQATLPGVQALGRDQQAALQEMAITALQAQKDRLDTYAAQARLAVAQLQDRGPVAQRAPAPAPTPATEASDAKR